MVVTTLVEVLLDPTRLCCLPPLRTTMTTTEDDGDDSGGGQGFHKGGAVGFGAGAMTDRVGGGSGGFKVVGNLRICYRRIVILHKCNECPHGRGGVETTAADSHDNASSGAA